MIWSLCEIGKPGDRRKKRKVKMAQPKKRLSKSAKAALKILEDSKLLKDSKTANEAKTPKNDKPANPTPQTSAPNKMRPAKKRG